jgi:hypothetical protein
LLDERLLETLLGADHAQCYTAERRQLGHDTCGALSKCPLLGETIQCVPKGVRRPHKVATEDTRAMRCWPNSDTGGGGMRTLGFFSIVSNLDRLLVLFGGIVGGCERPPARKPE